MFCRAWLGGIAAGSGWQRINASLPPGPPVGRCLHRPGNPAMPQTPCGGRDRPPYIAAASGWQCINASLPPGPPEGRCLHRSLRRGRSGRSVRKAARRRGTVCRPRLCRPFALRCRAGVHARRGALRWPGRILGGQGAAPLSRLTPPAPLTGEPFGRQALDKASPARGGVTEGDGGVHCRFALEISCKARQSLARHP